MEYQFSLNSNSVILKLGLEQINHQKAKELIKELNLNSLVSYIAFCQSDYFVCHMF